MEAWADLDLHCSHMPIDTFLHGIAHLDLSHIVINFFLPMNYELSCHQKFKKIDSDIINQCYLYCHMYTSWQHGNSKQAANIMLMLILKVQKSEMRVKG